MHRSVSKHFNESFFFLPETKISGMRREIYLAVSTGVWPDSSRDQRSHNLTFLNEDPEWAFGNDQEVLSTRRSVGGS